ncbi:helix-turn-helix transcriptional regulator [Streptomyces albiflaviniger]|nr:helix-turn-helix transcriptional regulator [Streptomyces albiflaviniger]
MAAAARAGRGEEAYLRVRARTGRRLSLWGSTLNGEPDNSASVVIQLTPVSEVTRTLARAYELTAREREILEQVIFSGRSSTGIASALTMSQYTVQEHLKSIFAKFGVRSRGQLVARALDIPPADGEPPRTRPREVSPPAAAGASGANSCRTERPRGHRGRPLELDRRGWPGAISRTTSGLRSNRRCPGRTRSHS